MISGLKTHISRAIRSRSKMLLSISPSTRETRWNAEGGLCFPLKIGFRQSAFPSRAAKKRCWGISGDIDHRFGLRHGRNNTTQAF